MCTLFQVGGGRGVWKSVFFYTCLNVDSYEQPLNKLSSHMLQALDSCKNYNHSFSLKLCLQKLVSQTLGTINNFLYVASTLVRKLWMDPQSHTILLDSLV